MAGKATEWPEGLSDEEAIMRLQSVMIAACEGNRDLSSDRSFKSLRGPLIRRPDLSDVVPGYIRAHRDLASMWVYLKGLSGQWQPRREHVWETFKPLLDRVEGKTKPPTSRAKWTGRRSSAQPAAVVLQLAPDALTGVEMLLAEQQRRLENGGPVEPAERQAIEALKLLHTEIGLLITSAEDGLPLEAQLATLRAARDKAFRWCSETFRLTLSEVPLMASSSVIGCGVMALVGAITQGAGNAATIGAAAMGVQGAAVLQRRKEAKGA